jgi:hypothetical protein
VHQAIGLDVDTSQRFARLSPANSNAPLPPSCSFTVGTTAVNHSAPTSASPVERNENQVEGEENEESTKDGLSYVIYALGLFSLFSLGCCYCREGVHEMVDPALVITQPATKESRPSTGPVATIKPSPPVPPRVAGSKRKFVDDHSTYSNSINPARKISKLPCVLYFSVMHLRC